jgi:peptide/nickel transport system substrate-binding protein
MLQNGHADRVTVDIPYVPEVKAMQGLKFYRVPQLSVSFALFCQNVDPTGNPNIGSGKLDGKGIPPDFFSDINVRRAFLHALDRKTYREDVFNGLVIMPTSPNIEGLPFHKAVPVYAFDLDKSKAALKKAWDGKVWHNGFKMVITYNSGNAMREAAAIMLAENIMFFITGWGADYADPHNFLYTFMHSRGVYGKFMAYKNNEVDRLCEAGIATVDPAKREEIYTRLPTAIGLRAMCPMRCSPMPGKISNTS